MIHAREPTGRLAQPGNEQAAPRREERKGRDGLRILFAWQVAW